MEKIDRYYLEITSIKNLKGKDKPSNKTILELVDNKNYEFNEFFYKQIGKKHHWVDRLAWTEKQWIEYIYNKKIKTYVLKKNENLAGYFELIIHEDKKEVEIAYFGLLEEFQNKKLGSFLLSSAIKNSFFKL